MRRPKTSLARRLAFYTARRLRPGKSPNPHHAGILAAHAATIHESWLYTLPKRFQDRRIEPMTDSEYHDFLVELAERLDEQDEIMVGNITAEEEE